MSSKIFTKDLDALESRVTDYFLELLSKQKEFILFSEVDLEVDTPDDYLECRNDITGEVFDVHPLKVSQDGILVIEADGSSVRHLLRLSDISNIKDKIFLCELMESKLEESYVSFFRKL